MAYPFAAAFSFKQLKTHLENEYSCQFKQGEELKNSSDESFRIVYVTRTVDGKEIKRAVEFGKDEEMVEPDVLRSISSRLKIDITTFPGYHLG